jgi:signal peptidase I
MKPIDWQDCAVRGLWSWTRRSKAFELALTLTVAFALALSVQAYAVKPYRIPSGSMEPTLQIGDRVLVNRFSHRLGSAPKVGDIVVFHPPSGAESGSPRCGRPDQGSGSPSPCSRPTTGVSSQTFIKRVVGVGGDRIAIRRGHVIRNGQLAREPFIAACGSGWECNLPREITVPSDAVFLMGDNRGMSLDSRFWGPVPVTRVIGQAVAVYWPPRDLGSP